MESHNTTDDSLHSHDTNDEKQSRQEQNATNSDIQSMGTTPTFPGHDQGGLSPDPPLSQYQGFWFPDIFLQTVRELAEDPSKFDASPSDIIICSCMKTGTTWLKSLAFVIATRARFNYDIDDAHGFGETNNPLLRSVPHGLIPFLEIDVSQNQLTRDPQLPLVATHSPYSCLPKSIISCGCKIVYIWRDPKDTFVSFWQFDNKARSKRGVDPMSLEIAFQLFYRGESPFGPYLDHVLEYWKASLDHPNKILFLKYEDMMANTLHYVKELAEFMGYPFSDDEDARAVGDKIVDMCSFENMSQYEVNKSGMYRAHDNFSHKNSSFFRKGKVGDWKNYLTAEMGKKLDEIANEKFNDFGLTL